MDRPARGEIIRSGARNLVRPRTVRDLVNLGDRTPC
jgi:hypothetical protein